MLLARTQLFQGQAPQVAAGLLAAEDQDKSDTRRSQRRSPCCVRLEGTCRLAPVEEISHLQTGVKLSHSEVDSLFLAHLRAPNEQQYSQALITCEAKQEGQRILDHQLVEQVVAASKSVRAAGMQITSVIPIAIKAIPESRIYFAEFAAWPIEATDVPEEDLPDMQLASEAVYELRPPVRGIGHTGPRPHRRLPR